MARERWFFAQGTQRRGPIPFQSLVETVLAQPDPRAVLVWRKGFADWTRAEDVPEVERRLTPFLVQRAAEDAARRGPTPAAVEAAARTMRGEEAKPGSPALVYGGIAGGVALLGLLAWLFWPRPQPQPATLPLGGTTPDNAPAVVIPAPTQQPLAVQTPPPTPPPTLAARATPTPAPTAAAAMPSDRESDIPARDLKRLRGVASWAGDVLKLTVYNGTTWRVTELSVKISRFKDDDFVEDARPLVLAPPGAAVDAGVADLLSRVAPDRKKPGLNPSDTGPFEGKAGPQPENFRWEIESARGYPPR